MVEITYLFLQKMNYSIQKHKEQEPDHLNIHWDTLTICQLKCSYCYARNEYGKEWGKISSLQIIDSVIESLERSSLPFNLGLLGGEPTLGPHYYYILDKITKLEKFKWIYVVTNAEKDLTKHPHYDNLSFLFSYHPADCTNDDKFLNNVKHITGRGYKSKVNLMLHHDKKLWPKIKEMFYTFKQIEGLKIHPHFLYGNSIQKLFNYRQDFWDYFNFFENEVDKELLYDDLPFNDYQIFRDGMTNFKGWSCYNNNYEIDVRGNVVKFCLPKTEGVNLLNNKNFFRDIKSTVPMICPHKACNCDGLLKQLKVKNDS